MLPEPGQPTLHPSSTQNPPVPLPRTHRSPTRIGSFSGSQGKLQRGAARKAAVRRHGWVLPRTGSATSSARFLQCDGGTPLQQPGCIPAVPTGAAPLPVQLLTVPSGSSDPSLSCRGGRSPPGLLLLPLPLLLHGDTQSLQRWGERSTERGTARSSTAERTLPPRPTHQGQLWVGARIHAELKVAGAEAQHGAPLTGQDRGADEGVGQAGPRRHRHQVGARAVLAVQGVDEGRQFVRVGFLGTKRGAVSPAPPMLPTHLAASLATPLQAVPCLPLRPPLSLLLPPNKTQTQSRATQDTNPRARGQKRQLGAHSSTVSVGKNNEACSKRRGAFPEGNINLSITSAATEGLRHSRVGALP